MIAGKYQYKGRVYFANNIQILINGVRCALIPGILDPLLCRNQVDKLTEFRSQKTPPFLNVGIQGMGFVLREYANPANV